MNYRDIVKEQIVEVIKKKVKFPKEEYYWDWILQNLISDSRDYETKAKQRWPLEPKDEAWKKYSTRTISSNEWENEFFKLFKEFFNEDFFI